MPLAPLTFTPLGAIKGSLKTAKMRDGKLLRKGQQYTQEEIAQAKRQRARIMATGSRADVAAVESALRIKHPGLSRKRLLRGGAS